MRRFLLAAAMMLPLVDAAPVIAQEGLPEPLPVRRWSKGALSGELQPLLFDQTRAFFSARGFGNKTAETLVQNGCVFRSSIGNRGDGPTAALDLSDWRVETRDGSGRPKLRSDWDPEWQAAGVGSQARIAFRWALFPDAQAFAPGDYNWGMITFGLAPGTRFDLVITWTEDGNVRETKLGGLECTSGDR